MKATICWEEDNGRRQTQRMPRWVTLPLSLPRCLSCLWLSVSLCIGNELTSLATLFCRGLYTNCRREELIPKTCHMLFWISLRTHSCEVCDLLLQGPLALRTRKLQSEAILSFKAKTFSLICGPQIKSTYLLACASDSNS